MTAIQQHEPKRYILNISNLMVHDRYNLTEQCNTDQIEHRKDVDIFDRDMYTPCKHCFK